MLVFEVGISPKKKDDFLDSCYTNYSLYVYKLAWQYSGPKLEVDDLVQEVWIRLCTKADKLATQTPAQQLAYISTTIRNTAISLMRQQQMEVSLDAVYGIGHNEADILNDILDRRISIQHFRQLWPKVPQPARELLERKYLLDESDVQIARAMGIGTNSVRMYLSRARKIALSVLGDHKDFFFDE